MRYSRTSPLLLNAVNHDAVVVPAVERDADRPAIDREVEALALRIVPVLEDDELPATAGARVRVVGDGRRELGPGDTGLTRLVPGRGSVGDVRVGHRDVDGLADLVANGDVEALADERSGGELAVTVLKFKGLNERAESKGRERSYRHV